MCSKHYKWLEPDAFCLTLTSCLVWSFFDKSFFLGRFSSDDGECIRIDCLLILGSIHKAADCSHRRMTCIEACCCTHKRGPEAQVMCHHKLEGRKIHLQMVIWNRLLSHILDNPRFHSHMPFRATGQAGCTRYP